MIRFKGLSTSDIIRFLLTGSVISGICFLHSTSLQAAIYPSRYKVPDNVAQLAVVKYKGSSKATFTFYQRSAKKSWKKIFSCGAWVGRNGLGKKKEGDKKTPIGLYSLEQPFGIQKDPGMDKSWHYLKVNKNHYWCGASKGSYSKYYNRLVTSKKYVPGEHLIDYKGSYDYGMFITYNKKGTLKKGSAIFLHCSKNKATSGCVAIKKKYLVKFMKKIRAGGHPSSLIYK